MDVAVEKGGQNGCAARIPGYDPFLSAQSGDLPVAAQGGDKARFQ